MSDYNHYFGVYPIQIIADAVQENRGMSQAVPQIRLNMAKLGLTPQGLADAGLDLGGVGKGLDIVDISHGGEKHITLRQTLPSRSATQEPNSPQTAPTFVPLLSDPAHPAHDLYAQTLRAFAASPQIAAAGYSGEQLQLIGANLVAGNVNVRESRNGPLLQERIDRVDAAPSPATAVTSPSSSVRRRMPPRSDSACRSSRRTAARSKRHRNWPSTV